MGVQVETTTRRNFCLKKKKKKFKSLAPERLLQPGGTTHRRLCPRCGQCSPLSVGWLTGRHTQEMGRGGLPKRKNREVEGGTRHTSSRRRHPTGPPHHCSSRHDSSTKDTHGHVRRGTSNLVESGDTLSILEVLGVEGGSGLKSGLVTRQRGKGAFGQGGGSWGRGQVVVIRCQRHCRRRQ
jgi:hypothetical protein